MKKVFHSAARGMRSALVAVVSLVVTGSIIAVGANYQMTQGSGTTFASAVISGVNYVEFLLCDATAGATQCAAVDSSGRVAIQAPASLPLPTGAATSANQSSQITQETAINTVLGTQADSVCGTATGSCTLQALIKFLNNAVTAAIPAGGNVIGFTTPDPCSQGTKINKPISQTTSTNLITGTSGKKLYICSLSLIVGGAENISFVEGTTGGTCGTSTAAVLGGATAANGPNLAANGGLTLGNGLGTIMSTATNNNDLCLFQSGTDRNAGNLTYVVQ